VLAAHPGFVSVNRFELLDADPRGGDHRGPRWLAVYEAVDEAAALQYIKDNERPWLHRRKYSPWPPARRKAKTVWRMLWQQQSLQAATGPVPEAVFMLGTNEADAPAPERQSQSDSFAARLELYRAFAHPEPGCPRFCTIYDAGAAAARRACAERDSVWRLVYRRIPPPD
jgi:hypothetical protein